ncbi:MAG: hypothetical protein GQ574_13710 [Crocinitomix sp.]|nr:hypothetical protein [Crocinitomix sp.]
MKNIALYLICMQVFVCFSCRDDEVSQTKDFTGNRLAMLQVDYLTYAFEGGFEYEFDDDSEGFTISGEYKPAGDFGWVKLYYDELDTLIFSGTVIWMGTGERSIPEIIDDATEFDLVEEALPLPSPELFNGEFEGLPVTTAFTDEEKVDIWASIAHLELVSAYREMNPTSKVHIFLYQPSVGEGNPADWDWLVFLKN